MKNFENDNLFSLCLLVFFCRAEDQPLADTRMDAGFCFTLSPCLFFCCTEKSITAIKKTDYADKNFSSLRHCYSLFHYHRFTLSPLLLVSLFAGGMYPFNMSESVTTVTELMAIANPANSGLNVILARG